MITPSFVFESQHLGPVAGLDEAGCGPWAGPVVAGAAILNPKILPSILIAELNDSKKLTDGKRRRLYEILHQENGHSCWIAFGSATVEEIDTLNIRQATQLAMVRALEKLAIQPIHLLVDGTHQLKTLMPCQAIIKGDQHSYSIAAASIIAKVTRDTLMQNLAQNHPQYGWDHNAGYGTKHHQKALKVYGVTAHHRKSFKPIARLLEL